MAEESEETVFDMAFAIPCSLIINKRYMKFDFYTGFVESDSSTGPWTPCEIASHAH